ncbi:MAG: C69 family dipeptidase [Clostridiales bacterium]|nr:C69 family dipeptidase [Clostridiales bacterium]
MKKTFTRKILVVFVAIMMIAASQVSAIACSTIFVGGHFTQDGAPFVARSEDYTNSLAKLMYLSPAGEYKANTLYTGCASYGSFEWTWTHDSYAWWAFKADNEFDGLCPECHLPGHPSYTEHGTNEFGVTVSATETTSGNSAVQALDPRVRTKVAGIVGIEETDIPTVILSEAKTAREGIDLLMFIYDKYGCYGTNGLFVSDQYETWYIENCTGHQYIAIKCNDGLMFLEPNMTMIGRVCLDDPDVIASAGIMDIAVRSGMFKGDLEKNIIEWRATYASSTATASSNRLSNGLNFINSGYSYTESILANDNTLYYITNVDKDDNMVPLHTNIQADRLLGPDDIANYFKVSGIANTSNTDTAFFQLYKDGRPFELSTVAWVQMGHGAYNVFIPFYPLLTDSLYEGYGHPVGQAAKNVTAANLATMLAGATPPNMYYRTSATGNYVVQPQNWEQNYFWVFDALSNYILYSTYSGGPVVTADKLQYVLGQFTYLQNGIYADFDGLNAQLPAMNLSSAATKAVASANFAGMAEKTHALALEMVKYLRAADTCKLTYVGADTLVGPVKNYAAGYTATVAGADNTGYCLLGWDTDPQAKTVVYEAGDTFEITSDTTLYAVQLPEVGIALSAPVVSYISGDACYTVSVLNAKDLLAVELEFNVEGSMLSGKGVEGLNGFEPMNGILWSYAGDGLWKGAVTLALPSESTTGLTSEDPVDIATFAYFPRAYGNAAMTITTANAVGLYGDTTRYLATVIENGTATTVIAKSKYDLNRDGIVDALDLGIMLLYCGFGANSDDWGTLVKVNDIWGNGVTASMCDVNDDGIIDMLDLLDLFIHYTK